METQLDALTRVELTRLTKSFFEAVSFEPGQKPSYELVAQLFINEGLLIKNSAAGQEICNLEQFIAPRREQFETGVLTCFREWELRASTDLFGNVAHRWSTYGKSGVLKGQPFEAVGVISTQFVRTAAGWRMTSMAWDDERPGLAIPPRYRVEQ